MDFPGAGVYHHESDVKICLFAFQKKNNLDSNIDWVFVYLITVLLLTFFTSFFTLLTVLLPSVDLLLLTLNMVHADPLQCNLERQTKVIVMTTSN